MASAARFAKRIINYLRDVDNAFNTLKMMFHHIGLWPGMKGSSSFPAKPLIQKWCPRFLLVVSAYFTLISSPLASYASRDEHIVEILEPLAFAFMTSMIFVYVCCLLYRGERFDRVFSTLYEMRDCASRYSLRPKAIKTQAKLYTDLFLAFGLQIVGIVIGFVMLGFPILILARKFLFGSWYPYDAKTSPYFELTTVLWIAYLPLGTILINAINMLLMYFCAQAIAHTRLLRFTLENIKALSVFAVKKRLEGNGLNAKDSDDQNEAALVEPAQLWSNYGGGSIRRGYINKMLLKKEMENIISLCVRHHQIINRFTLEVGSAFGPILVSQVNNCLFPTAMSIILVLLAQEMNFKILMFVNLTIITFGNLFVFCFLAQEVATETSLVSDSMYTSDWLEASNSFKRSMLVIMTRCNQPLVMTVADFIPLDVRLFITMIKMTYSYYMSAMEMLNMKKSTDALDN